MSAFLAGAGRVLAMWLAFGLIASWLHHDLGVAESVAVIGAGVLAYALNRAWREQQRHRLAREHREAVEQDEEIRAMVRERRRRG